MAKRILGDLRIFQAIFNDLHLSHNPDGHSYIYPGIDPYELEDDSFPMTVATIQKLLSEAYQRGRIDEAKICEEARRHE